MTLPLRNKQASSDLRSQYLKPQLSSCSTQQNSRSIQATMTTSFPLTPVEGIVPSSEPPNPGFGTAREANNAAPFRTPPISLFPRMYNPTVWTMPDIRSREPSSPSSKADTTDTQAGGSSYAVSPAQLGLNPRSNNPSIIQQADTIRKTDPNTPNENPITSSRRPEHSTTRTSATETSTASGTSTAPTLPQSRPANSVTIPDQSPRAEPGQPTIPPLADNNRFQPPPAACEDVQSDAGSDSTESLEASTVSAATEEIPRPDLFPRAGFHGERVHWVSVSSVRQVTTREMTVIELWREQVPRNHVFDDNDSIWQSSGVDTVLSDTESPSFDRDSIRVVAEGGAGVAPIGDTACPGSGQPHDNGVMRDQGTQTDEVSPLIVGDEAVCRDRGAQTDAATPITANEDISTRNEPTQTDNVITRTYDRSSVYDRDWPASCAEESPPATPANAGPSIPAVAIVTAIPAASPSPTAAPAPAVQEAVSPRVQALRSDTLTSSELEWCFEHNRRYCLPCSHGYGSSSDESSSGPPSSLSPSFTPGDDAAFQRRARIQSRLRRVRSALKKRVIHSLEERLFKHTQEELTCREECCHG